MHILGFLIIGAIVGWLAGKIMSGRGYGLIWDIVLGIIGAVVGGFVFSTLLGIQPTGLVVSFIISLLGAIIVVGAVHLLRGETIRTT